MQIYLALDLSEGLRSQLVWIYVVVRRTSIVLGSGTFEGNILSWALCLVLGRSRI